MIHRQLNHITRLPRNATLAFWAGAAGAAVLCRSGTCWATRQDDHEDHILTAGAAYRPRGQGLVVVCALSDAEIEIEGRVVARRELHPAHVTI